MTLLIGAGGHAKVVAEILAANGTPVVRYVDPATAAWLEVEQLTSDEDALAAAPGEAAMGVGGMTPDALTTRLALTQRYLEAGWTFPPVCHASAIISPGAEIGDGALVLASTIVQPDASIGTGAIINTGAVVEHDCKIGDGVHVGPGAIVLGEVTIGAAAMIGAGSLILPGTDIPAGTLVRALERNSVS